MGETLDSLIKAALRDGYELHFRSEIFNRETHYIVYVEKIINDEIYRTMWRTTVPQALPMCLKNARLKFERELSQ